MAANSPEDKLLIAACARLKKLIHTRSAKDVGIDAFVVKQGGHHYAVRVSQVAQRPSPVFHLVLYNTNGVYKTAAMVPESMLLSLGTEEKTRPQKA